MYVAPNSEIRLLRNVPIDSSYRDSFYFSSLSEQITYFNSFVKQSFTQQSYQRVNRGYLRIQQSADNLYDCNYLMFRNTSFGNKWFFAFINAVEYINNATTQISFTIDSLMTWYFEMTIPQCYIVRQHTYNDEIGANIEPEPFQMGEYTYEDYANLDVSLVSNFKFIVAVSDSDIYPETYVQKYGNLISGAILYVFNENELQEIKDLLDEYIATPDEIVSMYCVPDWLIDSSEISSDHRYISGASSFRTITKSAISASDGFDGYIPMNNKLYTYPYNYYHVDNGNGQALSLRYEFFENHAPQFFIRGTILSPVQVSLNPYNYKGITTSSGQSVQGVMTECISLQNYPQCSWNIDTYKAWLAQNSTPIMLNGIANALKLYTFAPSMFTSTPTMESSIIKAPASLGQASMSVFNQTSTHKFDIPGKEEFNPKSLAPAGSSIIDTVSSIYEASYLADVCKNSMDVGNINCATGRQTFYGGRVHLNKNEIQHIDSFFSAYGYAYNKIGSPHMGSGRKAFCYVQTKGCVVRGNLPNDDKVMIQNIMDNGIRFWNDKSNVGDLAQDNPII